MQLSHVYRQANRVADFVASMGHSLNKGLHVFCVPPMDIHSLLDENSWEVVFPHLIVWFFFGWAFAWFTYQKEKKKERKKANPQDLRKSQNLSYSHSLTI